MFQRRSVLVVSSLVALPTCGCQCHKWPCQRGKVILLGRFGLVRAVSPPGFAPVKENMFSERIACMSSGCLDSCSHFWCGVHNCVCVRAHVCWCYWDKYLTLLSVQPMEVFVDDETKLTLHGLQQYYCKLKDSEKNRKLFDLLDVLEFNQVMLGIFTSYLIGYGRIWIL